MLLIFSRANVSQFSRFGDEEEQKRNFHASICDDDKNAKRKTTMKLTIVK